jgi:hypothetical protein
MSTPNRSVPINSSRYSPYDRFAKMRLLDEKYREFKMLLNEAYFENLSSFGNRFGSSYVPHELGTGYGSSYVPHELGTGYGSSYVPHELGTGFGSSYVPHTLISSFGFNGSSVRPTVQSGTSSVASSVAPSVASSVAPSVASSVAPSVAPSVASSVAPSVASSVAPSVAPSVASSVAPSVAPSVASSVAPSVASSVAPSVAPQVNYKKYLCEITFTYNGKDNEPIKKIVKVGIQNYTINTETEKQNRIAIEKLIKEQLDLLVKKILGIDEFNGKIEYNIKENSNLTLFDMNLLLTDKDNYQVKFMSNNVK